MVAMVRLVKVPNDGNMDPTAAAKPQEKNANIDIAKKYTLY